MRNLEANPRLELLGGTSLRDVTAREVSAEDAPQWWERCVAASPDHQRTTGREIPVLGLEPVAT